MRHYRSRFEIIRDILEVVKRRSRKTRIMYLGNLSYELLQKYLELLGTSGMIEVQDSVENTYIITKKGLNFLTEYDEFLQHVQKAEGKKRILEHELAAHRTS